MHYLWIVLTVLAGLLNQQDKPKECLIFHSATNLNILSLHDNTVTTVPFSDFYLPPTVYTSPNGTRKIAVSEASVELSSGKVSVEKIDPPIPFASNWREQHDPLGTAAIWSPNSNMFVYLYTKADKTTYIGLADPDGIIQKEILLLDSSEYLAQLDLWSPDNQYFTVLVRTKDSIGGRFDEQIEVKIFSAPDLKDVTPKSISPVPHHSCDWSNYWEVYCTNWSTIGHKIAFINQMNTDFYVVIATLDVSTVERYPLPVLDENEVHYWFILWSPDNQKVAVTYGASRVLAQLEVFYADGTKHVSIGENSHSALFRADGAPHPQWAWSADSNMIFYIQYNPNEDSSFDAVMYNITANQRTNLITFPSINTGVNLEPSSDNQSILIYAYNHEKTSIFLVSVEGKELWRKLVDANYGDYFTARSGWSAHNSYLATLKDIDLTVYRSDGSIFYRKEIDPNLMAVFIDWVDCT